MRPRRSRFAARVRARRSPVRDPPLRGEGRATSVYLARSGGRVCSRAGAAISAHMRCATTGPTVRWRNPEPTERVGCEREDSNLHPLRDRDLTRRVCQFRHARSVPGRPVTRELRPWPAGCPRRVASCHAQPRCAPRSMPLAWTLRRSLPAPAQGADRLHRRAIDQVTANSICAQLLLLEAEDTERDISLYINSPGGSVTDGLAIYDTMQYVSPTSRTICIGMAASMGQFLLCAGAPGKRFSLPQSNPDAPADGRDAGSGLGYRDPGRADRLHEEAAGRADRLSHRQDARRDRSGLGPRPLVHRARGAGVRLHRQSSNVCGTAARRLCTGRHGSVGATSDANEGPRWRPTPVAWRSGAARAARITRIVSPNRVWHRLREIWLSLSS